MDDELRFGVHGGLEAHEGRRRGSTKPRLMGEYLEEETARRGSAARARITPDRSGTDLPDARTLGAAICGSRLSLSGSGR